MPADFSIQAGPEWKRFAAALDRAPRNLRIQSRQRMRATAEVGVAAAHRRAAEILPQTGGLAGQVAATPILIDLDDTPATVKVRIYVKGTQPGLDRGRFRHPVFGHKDRWTGQTVRPGWFSVPMRELRPVMVRQLATGIREVLSDLERESR